MYDAVATLYQTGVNSDAIRLWCKLNQNTQIRIKTSAGMTESVEVGDVIGQGTAGAALVSQLNLDYGLHRYFAGSADEVYYGGVRCEYFAYQDDIGKPCAGVNEAQAANIKLSHMFKEKGLEAHPDKTCYVVFGSKSYKDKVNEQLETNPLYLGDFQVKRKESDRYLGQILHTNGVRASCEATITDREGKIKGATFEVQSIVEDFKMQAIGGMMTAWELWEKAMIPSLLSGAGTWTGITSAEVDKLDWLQDFYWRVILRVPESCPRIALRAETRMIGMKHRIWQYKLSLIKRIKAQSTDTLSRKILEEQITHDWPGLSQEVADICEQLNIPDIRHQDSKDGCFKNAIFEHHYLELKEKIAGSKKMMKHQNDDFRNVQGYMKEKSIEKSRTSFKIRCEMIPEIKGNFKDRNRRKGGEEALKCQECSTGEI